MTNGQSSLPRIGIVSPTFLRLYLLTGQKPAGGFSGVTKNASGIFIPMKKPLLFALLVVGLSAGLAAKELPQISFVTPGASREVPTRDQFVMLVVEGATLSHEKNPVPAGDVVDYVNGLLKAKGVTSLALHVREGTRYGELVRALDLLSGTSAKAIGVSTKELPAGKEP